MIDGKQIAREIRENLKTEVEELKNRGVTPGLAAVLVGEDEASKVYVAGKEKAAAEAGMASFVHRLPASTSQEELLALIDELNRDDRVHGILVQMPLPKGLDEVVAQDAVDPRKDVDGLHPENAGLLSLGRPRFVPCTPLGVKVLLERSGTKVEGAKVVVVGRSNLVGRPVSILLSHKADGANATVTLCHTGTTNLEEHTREADIVVVAAGKPAAVTGAMIKPGATVIDVGINRVEGKLVGDVDFESASEIAGAITPVPGGVGPMTIAMLLSNTVRAAQELSR
ncbi:MAG: bifunctional 5,10-methylenetetrahydrofolate dehydrogenase/5,10-methenyltetrahydrofolate cyclohydrolase [Actinobacteria bacterium]|nr:bifunctional 5,10-methylenetetrahydrofolate dehydrogenase/5,10-methenyltetrahydrofolate cyclohydrolase [Actinomycetota bacterium]